MDDWTEDFVNYIGSFEPEFLERIEGASEDEIAKLEALLRRPVPEAYRHFLRRFGANDGGLFVADRAVTSVHGVMERIEEYYEEFPDISFSECVPFAFPDVEEGMGLHTRAEFKEPPVVWMEDGGPDRDVEPLAQSLPALCYAYAFGRHRSFLGYDAMLLVEGASIDELLNAGKEAGFEPQWFSSGNRTFAKREDALLTINPKAQALQLYVTAPSREDAKQIGEDLTGHFQANFVRFLARVRPPRDWSELDPAARILDPA